jgi:hypothetical protein
MEKQWWWKLRAKECHFPETVQATADEKAQNDRKRRVLYGAPPIGGMRLMLVDTVDMVDEVDECGAGIEGPIGPKKAGSTCLSAARPTLSD